MTSKTYESRVVSTASGRARVFGLVRDLTELTTVLRPHFSIIISTIPVIPGDLTCLGPAPTLPVCVGVDAILLGPLFILGHAVCPGCLEHWLMMDQRPVLSQPLLDRVTSSIEQRLSMWSETLRRYECVEEVRTRALAIDVRTSDVEFHPVFPLRGCPNCSQLGQHTASLHTHCSRWTGIVTQVEVTERPAAGAYRGRATWRAPLPVTEMAAHLKPFPSYGRGKTAAAAIEGCVGEALERYSLIYRGDEPLVRETFDAAVAIHPDEIQLFSRQQILARARTNARVDDEFWVPEPFRMDIAVDWMTATCLTPPGGQRLVPAAACLMWYQFRPGEPEFARADTIGCAAAETFDEALTRALLEWVERDAVAIWWDNRLTRPAVRLQSFDSEGLLAVSDALRAIDRKLYLLDCTTDIGLPTYVAVAPRVDGSEPLLGAAADFSPAMAAYRAATEAGQVWHALRSGGGASRPTRRWLLHATLASHPYLAPSGWIDAAADPGATKARHDWRHIVERLDGVGLNALVVDHTRADVCCRAIRAIVPGLRHVWNRRAPGRLYEVPVRMGWRRKPTNERAMNPTPCMM
jgi:thiazole/oxazole-forming peptide maturase SagD family component